MLLANNYNIAPRSIKMSIFLVALAVLLLHS